MKNKEPIDIFREILSMMFNEKDTNELIELLGYDLKIDNTTTYNIDYSIGKYIH